MNIPAFASEPTDRDTDGGRPRRQFAPQAPSHVVRALCQSVLGAELLSPGQRFWMAVRRVGNVPLIDNRANAFRHLEPYWPQAEIRLLSVLEKLLGEGVDVRVLTEADRSNDSFAGEFQGMLSEPVSDSYREVSSWESVQEGLMSSSFYLEGTLRFSRHGGTTVGGRGLRVYTDGDKVSEGRAAFQEQWQEVGRP